MRRILTRLWDDDRGALIASEWLFVATLFVTGMVVGLTYVRNSVTAGLYEFGNAVNALSQAYAFPTLTDSTSTAIMVQGSATSDMPDSHLIVQTNVTAEDINVPADPAPTSTP